MPLEYAPQALRQLGVGLRVCEKILETCCVHDSEAWCEFTKALL
jgi:hypothetical protein